MALGIPVKTIAFYMDSLEFLVKSNGFGKALIANLLPHTWLKILSMDSIHNVRKHFIIFVYFLHPYEKETFPFLSLMKNEIFPS